MTVPPPAAFIVLASNAVAEIFLSCGQPGFAVDSATSLSL